MSNRGTEQFSSGLPLRTCCEDRCLNAPAELICSDLPSAAERRRRPSTASLVRWPEGFTCPGCEGRKHCIVKRGARILYQCNACRKQTSITAGTMFASSKLGLRLWFKAMYLLTQSKKGISSLELGRRLGVTQTTAWTLKHKLAQVMIERNAAKRLRGEVQMDDAYIGGRHPGTHGRGAAGKTPFVAAVSITLRWQTRSDRPSPRCQVQQNCDRQTCGHDA